MKEIKFFTQTLLRFMGITIVLIIFALLVYLFALFSYAEQHDNYSNPSYALRLVKSDGLFDLSKETQSFLRHNNIGLLVLDGDGNCLSSFEAPQELVRDYSALEVASFSRWYLKDYPVFSYIVDDKLLVFIYPKDSYTKFSSLYMQVSDFNFLLALPLIILAALFIILFVSYYASKHAINKEITPITKSIIKLSDNQSVELDEKGQLKHIKAALNKTSQNLEQAKLQRNSWLRGISHDLRTPLALISAYTQKLSDELPEHKSLKVIESNTQSITRILDGLNMVYRLESGEGIAKVSKIDLEALLRDMSIALLNSIERDFTIEFVHFERLSIDGDKNLIERAIRNVLLNSIYHNDQVAIKISLTKSGKSACVTIEDNGGISKEKLEEIDSSDYLNNHANFGISILKRIVALHAGTLELSYNNPGLCTKLFFNLSER